MFKHLAPSSMTRQFRHDDGILHEASDSIICTALKKADKLVPNMGIVSIFVARLLMNGENIC
jgi:hypothetical protein